MEIPDRLKKFPLWMGKYPIHFTQTVENGVPKWKVLDRKKQVECINKGRCHLCGEKLYAPYWWVCGPDEYKRRAVMSNGPMHEECARFAIFICPFLNNPNYRSKTDLYKDNEESPQVIKQMIEMGMEPDITRPARIALCTSNGYYVDSTQQMFEFQITEWTSVDWDVAPKRTDDAPQESP